jgi:hypothetical protein
VHQVMSKLFEERALRKIEDERPGIFHE